LSAAAKAVFRPAQVQILLTERCNLRCRHCAVPEEDSPAEDELDGALWRAFVAQLAREGVRSLVLSGGEALLRPEAVGLAVHALESGMERTTLVTNGLLFRGDIPARIAAAQRRFRHFGVHVSLDGSSPQTHDWMRGKGSFRRTLRSLDRLFAAGGRITGLHTVLHRGNLHEVDQCAQLAASLGAQVWTVFPIAALGRGIGIQAQRLDEASWRALLHRFTDLEKRHGLTIGVMGPVLGDEWSAAAPDTPRPRAEHAQQTCVGPDGSVFTCPPLRDRPAGSVQDVVRQSSWAPTAERAGDLLTSECSSCKLILLCTGVDLSAPLRPAGGPVTARQAAEAESSRINAMD
jgi:radical SAM protein with 4Fe4S-binding SPASM domain